MTTSALIRTVSDLVTEVREELDEPVGDGNLWSDTEIVKWMNRGMRKIWARVRREKENWFLRKVRSTDEGELNLYGHEYDPLNLKLQASEGTTTGPTELVLPPDCFEIRMFEPITNSSTDGQDDQVQFFFSDLANQKFRALSRATGSEVGGIYLCELIFREDGPKLIITPSVQLSNPMDTLLEYVFMPGELTAEDTFEGTGFNPMMLDALVAWTVYRARKKENVQEHIQTALLDVQDSLNEVGASAGPRQSRDDEVVSGFLEDYIE